MEDKKIKKGQQIVCPHCQNDSIVIQKKELDGWTVKEEYLACALCSAKLADIELDLQVESNHDSSKNIDKLSDLFGGEVVDKITPLEILGDLSSEKFCRDCKHCIIHPFLNRCHLHGKEVELMADCQDFEQRQDKD